MQVGTQASIPKERLPMLSRKHEVNVHRGKRLGHEVVSPEDTTPLGLNNFNTHTQGSRETRQPWAVGQSPVGAEDTIYRLLLM